MPGSTLFSRVEMHQMVSNGIVTVIFRKANGDIRHMRCTLLPEYIQTEKQLLQEGQVARTPNPDTLAVWDVDASGWRSFRLDSVISAS